MKKIGLQLYNYIYSYYSREDDEEMFTTFFIVSCAVIAALSMHISLIIFYAFLKIKSMILLNAVSMILHTLCFILIKNENFSLAGNLLSLEILYYTTVSIYFMGTSSYVVLYLIVVAVLQVVMPYTSSNLRTFTLASTWSVIMIVVCCTTNYVPIIDLSHVEPIPTIFNVNLGLIALLLEISIGSATRKVISSFQNQKIESFKTQAYTDELTGLYNRRYANVYFDDIIQKETHPTNKYCAMLDIDNFKKINDTYGHSVGDVVLKELATTIKGSFRKQDTLFRWGGEEFLIVINNVDLDLTITILEKLRKKIESLEITHENIKISITVTIGIAELDKNDFWRSIDSCDKKMYEGKRTGKNKISY